jgi:hypothetical protein
MKSFGRRGGVVDCLYIGFVTLVVLTGVQALNDGCSVNEVAPAQDTHQMLIHFLQMQPARPLHSLACNTTTFIVTMDHFVWWIARILRFKSSEWHAIEI